MSALIIRHLTSEGREHRFQVQRLSDGKSADPVSLTDPSTTPVPDRPQSGLSTELRWYLERFLEYPFLPETDRAERVQAVLNDWGQGQREGSRLLPRRRAFRARALQQPLLREHAQRLRGQHAD
jgi:hypothetical protein